ncbi:MAG: hypothetical protein C4B59_01650 [Candidatus Methanogaster sp.]|uniref:Uncharacterized protein n=1 Tax=Candidatus Methanogaster sp. TaxID=3386292 RepID=A0AC61L6S4_9EURY|nr:MAG: hypothetical protein C4B59_01650 [ANME-2 cluster archaeon]
MRIGRCLEHTTPSKSGNPPHESGGPIKSVSIISTGTGEAHRKHIYGTRKPVLWYIREILHADLVVSSEAWEHMLGPHPEREGVFRRDIELPGAKWQRISFQPTDDPSLTPFTHAFDLMGDGSMVMLPTPGYLPGSLSMLVRRDGAPPLLLVDDLCYGLELLERCQLPGTGDRKELRASYAKVLALKERMPDLVILPAHDPEAAGALREATSTDVDEGPDN